MTGPVTTDVLIVGTGHAGAATAISLRRLGFAGSITMVGRDTDPPYERPPLTKDYLLGLKAFDRILIRPPSFWAEHRIALGLGRTLVSIDVAARVATFNDSATIAFGELVWAAGGRARRLSCGGADLAGVHTVRDRTDVDRLRSEFDAGARRVVVIGGGYIGLEAAAVLTKLGATVTVLEALDRVLARVAGEPLSRFIEQLHRHNGVDVRLGVTVDSIAGTNGCVTGVVLAGGEQLPADLVIVGIGIEPIVPKFIGPGVRIGNGVQVDAYCRSTAPHIYAVGDCAAHANRFAAGAQVRLESVQNAHDMGLTAAKNIVGAPEPYAATPWFWSNQYDIRLQTVGLNHGYDQIVLRGSPADRSFSVVYLRDGAVIALDCLNASKDYVQGRKLVEAGLTVNSGRIADTTIKLGD